MAQFPYEIVRMVLSYLFIGKDRDAIISLSLVSRDFLLPCREILFEELLFDFRLQAASRQGDAVGKTVDQNPEYHSFVRRLSFIDNGSSPFKPCQWIQHRGSSTPTSGQNEDVGTRQQDLFSNRTSYALSFILRNLRDISTFSMVFTNFACNCRDFSSAVSNELARIFRLDTLQDLRLEGVSNIPFDFLLSFPDLRVLQILNCSMGTLHDTKRLDLQHRASTSRIPVHKSDEQPSRRPHRRLESLIIDGLDPSDFEMLVGDFWMIDWGVDHVDLSTPLHVEIRHAPLPAGCQARDAEIPALVLDRAANMLESLTIDTVGMGAAYLFSMKNVSEAQHADFADRLEQFMGYVDPSSFGSSLTYLTLKVAHWPRFNALSVNGELRWALELLRAASGAHIVTVEVHVHVVGRTSLDVSLNLSSLRRYSGWRDWDDVMANSKWVALESFIIVICADGDANSSSNLNLSLPSLESVLFDGFPFFKRSGKLRVLRRKDTGKSDDRHH